jgi:hypothetical protein
MDPGSGMGKKSGSGSGMNNQDHISESLETIRDGRNSDQGTGMKKFGSGINIPDPQHWYQGYIQHTLKLG